VVCNSGTSLVPTVDGEMHHFKYVGLYDGLAVMQDSESKTLWNHITGEADYGPLVGRTLGPLSNLLYLDVNQALAIDPGMEIAISDRTYFAGGKSFGSAQGFDGSRWAPGNSNAQLPAAFVQTLGTEDTRRLRMDMGLGVWTSTTSRYYPMELVHRRGDAFVDQIGGRRVLIYIEPDTSVPAALFVNAKRASLRAGDVRLDDGTVVRKGVLRDRGGKALKIDRPQQIFTRWYGFSLTFPGCEIAGTH